MSSESSVSSPPSSKSSPPRWLNMRNTIVTSILLGIASLVIPYANQVHAATVDTYIASEGPIAKAGVLANIGSSGSKSNGAKAGIVRSCHTLSLRSSHVLMTK